MDTGEKGTSGHMGAMANGLMGKWGLKKNGFSNYGIALNTTLKKCIGV